MWRMAPTSGIFLGFATRAAVHAAPFQGPEGAPVTPETPEAAIYPHKGDQFPVACLSMQLQTGVACL